MLSFTMPNNGRPLQEVGDFHNKCWCEALNRQFLVDAVIR